MLRQAREAGLPRLEPLLAIVQQVVPRDVQQQEANDRQREQHARLGAGGGGRVERRGRCALKQRGEHAAVWRGCARAAGAGSAALAVRRARVDQDRAGYEPTLHGAHVFMPALGATVPGLHGAATAAPAGQYAPTGHTGQSSSCLEAKSEVRTRLRRTALTPSGRSPPGSCRGGTACTSWWPCLAALVTTRPWLGCAALRSAWGGVCMCACSGHQHPGQHTVHARPCPEPWRGSALWPTPAGASGELTRRHRRLASTSMAPCTLCTRRGAWAREATVAEVSLMSNYLPHGNGAGGGTGGGAQIQIT